MVLVTIEAPILKGCLGPGLPGPSDAAGGWAPGVGAFWLVPKPKTLNPKRFPESPIPRIQGMYLKS